MKNKKRVLHIILFIIVVFGIFGIITLPPCVYPPKLIEIPENMTALQVGKILKENNIIKSVNLFLFLTNREKVQNKIKSGVYEFSGRTSLRKVVRKLVKGEIKLVKVTIPEGLNIKEIGEILEKKGVIKNKDEFIKHAQEKKLEGFLFPDTYFFPVKTSVEGIAYSMWKRFNDVWYEITGEKITEENFKEVKKVLTVASIVEKEGICPEEKRIIAGIIYKRIKKGLPIQSCATVEYALGYHKTRLNEEDLKIKSPYNTYIHKGLPPTPICNPGKDSIKASLKPKKTDYLFFLSKGDGTSYFSKTYKEHVYAKELYLSPKEEKVENETLYFLETNIKEKS